jgi:hypothetical protein
MFVNKNTLTIKQFINTTSKKAAQAPSFDDFLSGFTAVSHSRQVSVENTLLKLHAK